MPIQLIWMPNSNPKPGNRIDIGLELGGDDATIAAAADGRIKLVEVASAAGAKGAGANEEKTERLIATFHGKFHRDPAALAATRLTFEIFTGTTTVGEHDEGVRGFDPECIFGVDAFVFSFLNREFIVWLPFYVDTREGKFLEIQAVAEVGAVGAATELGRSMVLNLGIHRSHGVDTTSSLPSGAPLAYTGDLAGNIVVLQESYLLPGGIPNAANSTPALISLDPALIPLPPSGTTLKFQPYAAGSMHIVLMTDLLDALSPPDSFLKSNIAGVKDAAPVSAATTAKFKSTLPTALARVFIDAGFSGADVRWSDDTASATLVSAFEGAFTQSRGTWTLDSATAPLVTSFWNFFIVAGPIPTAGSGELLETQNKPTTVGSKSVYLKHTVPIGSGTKPLTKPIEVNTVLFQELLMERSGIARTYKDRADYDSAVDKVAGKMVVILAHEVGHALGLMHHSLVLNSGNYSEDGGSPVLSIMSSGVESGGFGVGLTFHSQAKRIWAQAFGVTPVFSDAILQNKTWTPAEVFTEDWSTRKTRFIRLHGEDSLSRPGMGVESPTLPPFTKDAPAAPQRGTFVPP